MSHAEIKQLEDLQRQLNSVQQEHHDTRLYLRQTDDEARLYRGLFWALLAVAGVVALASVLNG